MRPTRADLPVCIVLVLLLGTFALAAIEISDETEARVKCATNLRQIGQALLLYSNENKGAFPRTIWDRNKTTPTWGTPYEANPNLIADTTDKTEADPFSDKDAARQPAANDVTAAFLLLLRTQDITSEVFVCPSSGQEKWLYGGGTRMPINWTNWPGVKAMAESLSYSYQNPYPSADAIARGWKLNNAISAEYVVAADMNPGVDALTKITMDSPPAEMSKGNSINHGGEGQNALFGDGHVAWEANPFIGVNRDNIYTFGGEGRDFKQKGGDGIVGPPTGPSDSIVLPTSKDLGNIDASGALTDAAKKRRDNAIAALKRPTPQQLEATKAKLPGTYLRADGRRPVKMTVTANKITATSGPLTIAFEYTIDGAGKDSVKLSLTAPDTKEAAVVKFNDTVITITGSPYLKGEWRRQ